MTYDRDRRQRRPTRLRGYDYAAPGTYFITICTRRRQMFFDQSELRQLAETCWRDIPNHAAHVELDEWVVMPAHIHGLIVIIEHGEANDGDVDTDVNGVGRGVQLNAPAWNTLNAPASNTLRGIDQHTGQIGEAAPAALSASARPRDVDNPFSVMSPRRNTLSVIVRTYKAALTSACRATQRSQFAWQRGFYEHVVRNPRQLDALRCYVRDNPLKWALDRDNPANTRRLPPPASVADYSEDLALTQTP